MLLLLTAGKCSYTLDFSDVVAGVMELKKNSSVLRCGRSWFSHVGRSSCAEMTMAVKRASEEVMSQYELLLVSSWFSLWLAMCIGNSGALEGENISTWLMHGSPL